MLGQPSLRNATLGRGLALTAEPKTATHRRLACGVPACALTIKVKPAQQMSRDSSQLSTRLGSLGTARWGQGPEKKQRNGLGAEEKDGRIARILQLILPLLWPAETFCGR